MFTKVVYRTDVDENVPNNTYVTTVTAIDTDTGLGGRE